MGETHLNTSSNSFDLKNVHVVPSIKRNLLLVHQFYNDNNSPFEFNSSNFFVKNKKNGMELLRCPILRTSLNPLSSNVVSVENKQQLPLVASRFSGDIWHRWLGHPSFHLLSIFIKNNIITFNSSLKLSVCNTCNMKKHVKLSFHDSESQSAFRFHIVHYDVWQSLVPSVSC